MANKHVRGTNAPGRAFRLVEPLRTRGKGAFVPFSFLSEAVKLLRGVDQTSEIIKAHVVVASERCKVMHWELALSALVKLILLARDP